MGRKKLPKLSDQLREILDSEATPSRYRLSKDAKVDASQLSRFIHGNGRLTTESLDRIGQVLRLRLVIADDV